MWHGLQIHIVVCIWTFLLMSLNGRSQTTNKRDGWSIKEIQYRHFQCDWSKLKFNLFVYISIWSVHRQNTPFSCRHIQSVKRKRVNWNSRIDLMLYNTSFIFQEKKKKIFYCVRGPEEEQRRVQSIPLIILLTIRFIRKKKKNILVAVSYTTVVDIKMADWIRVKCVKRPKRNI